jgi:hypothetical protein
MDALIFEKIYDKYAGIIYGIALEICSDKNDAEQIFISIFKKIYDDNLTIKNSPNYYITLIKLIMDTAKAELNNSNNLELISLKQFENTPVLHNLICNDITLDAYCEINYIPVQNGLLMIKNEFNILRGIKSVAI